MNTSGSNQIIRVSGGKRALYDAYDYSLHHPQTDQMTSGIYSHEHGKWFSCAFNYHMYMYEHGFGPYGDPRYRSQAKETMEATAARCCPKEMIETRRSQYNIHT